MNDTSENKELSKEELLKNANKPENSKKKKPAKRKSFAQRVSKHYKTIDNIMLMTVAKDVKKKEQERAALKKKNSYKTKLRDLEIQDAEFIEL